MKINFPFLPPSVNQLYVTNWSTKLRFKSKKYSEFLEACQAYVGKESLKGQVQVEYNYYWKDKRRRDLANLEKATSDMLVMYGVIEDDSCIQRMVLERGHGEPETWIEINPYNNETT